MSSILKSLNQRPISFFPIYRDVTGSMTGAILLSQLMYWFSKKDKIYKTDTEVMSETRLSRGELESAKKLIKSCGFIIVTREGIPAKTFYEINWESYNNVLASICENNNVINNTEIQETDEKQNNTSEQDYRNSGNCVAEVDETINDKSFDIDYTENTTVILPREKSHSKNKTSFPSDDSELKAYAIIKATDDGIKCPITTYESFKDHHIANGSKFNDWKRAFNLWTRNFYQFKTENFKEKVDVQLDGYPHLVGTYSYDEELFYDEHNQPKMKIPKSIFVNQLIAGSIKPAGRAA